MYAPLTAQDRCDRCGAQAKYVTAHLKSTLMWCAHHFRKHEDALAQDLIFMTTESETKETQPA